MKLTAEELQAIRERAEKATAGPWELDEDNQRGIWNQGGHNYLGGLSLPEADADFIAESRTDVPRLLELVAQQAAEVERLKTELEAERKAQSDIIEELFGDKIRENAEKIADELRGKFGEPE